MTQLTANQMRYFDRGRRAFRDGLAREALASLYSPGTEEYEYAFLGWCEAAGAA